MRLVLIRNCQDCVILSPEGAKNLLLRFFVVRLWRTPQNDGRIKNANWKYTLSVIMLVLFISPPCYASKEADVKMGNELFESSDFEGAVDKYSQALKSDPNSDIINYNLGTALYKNKNYQEATGHLQKSLLTEDEKLKQKTHYNLGNNLYRFGIDKEAFDLNGAVQSLEEALAHCERAFTIDTEDEDASFNYEFVKKELERLKKKLQQQQQQKQKQQKQQEQENQQEQQQQEQSQESQKNQESQAQESQQQDKNQQQKEESEQQQKEGESVEEDGQDNSTQQREYEQTPPKQAFSESDSKELTPQEAEMLLKNYQQTEEPKGLYNLRIQRVLERPVEKDW